MRGIICDLLSEEPMEHAGGNVQQLVKIGHEFRRQFVLREMWESRRMDGRSP